MSTPLHCFFVASEVVFLFFIMLSHGYWINQSLPPGCVSPLTSQQILIQVTDAPLSLKPIWKILSL